MNKINVAILSPPDNISHIEQMMVTCARLTQRGHTIKNINDFNDLYNREYSKDLIERFTKQPHPTLQKFGTINVVVVGCSRRFLAQITRHQNEVKFMSTSLQYSDYSDYGTEDSFVVPYEIIDNPIQINEYMMACDNAMSIYKLLAQTNNDAAGYIIPQGLRGTLIISATPFQWKHMIQQRICRRNTLETRYIMLKIWEKLYEISQELFNINTTAPNCCIEGKMGCGKPIGNLTPTEILNIDFNKLKEDANGV